jgi:hypothetical protein
MLLFVTVENKKNVLAEAKVDSYRKSCIVGGAREEKSYFENKVFLVDNFWGQKEGMTGNCKYNKCGNSENDTLKKCTKMGQYIIYRKQTEVAFDTGIHNSQAPYNARQLQIFI